MKITMSVLFGVTVPDDVVPNTLNLEFDFSKIQVVGDDGLRIVPSRVVSYGCADVVRVRPGGDPAEGPQRELPDPEERLATDIEHGGEYEGVETIVINGRRMKHPAPAADGWVPLPIEAKPLRLNASKEYKNVQGQFYYRDKK